LHFIDFPAVAAGRAEAAEGIPEEDGENFGDTWRGRVSTVRRSALSLLFALVLAAVLSAPAAAPVSANPSPTKAAFTIGSTTYTVNGHNFDMDAAPFINGDGRTMVPVRFLAFSLGASVNWDARTRTVTLAEGNTTEVMVIGSAVLVVNGHPERMDAAPAVIPPGRIELPARFVAQAFGYGVAWDPSVQTVTISMPRNQGVPAEVASPPNILTVVRYNDMQPIPPLEVTIDEPAVVQNVYAALSAIPPASRFPGPYYCPSDFGINYVLTFRHGEAAVLSATADPGG